MPAQKRARAQVVDVIDQHNARALTLRVKAKADDAAVPDNDDNNDDDAIGERLDDERSVDAEPLSSSSGSVDESAPSLVRGATSVASVLAVRADALLDAASERCRSRLVGVLGQACTLPLARLSCARARARCDAGSCCGAPAVAAC